MAMNQRSEQPLQRMGLAMHQTGLVLQVKTITKFLHLGRGRCFQQMSLWAQDMFLHTRSTKTIPYLILEEINWHHDRSGELRGPKTDDNLKDFMVQRSIGQTHLSSLLGLWPLAKLGSLKSILAD